MPYDFSSTNPLLLTPVSRTIHVSRYLQIHACTLKLESHLQLYQTPENARHCYSVPDTQVGDTWQVLVDTLPITADLLFFLSRGAVSGDINIVANRNFSHRSIEVTVAAQYEDIKDLEHTKVCRMGHSEEHGVLIWRDPDVKSNRDVRFNITVSLPYRGRYKDLTTDLARFTHRVGDFFDLWSPTDSFEDIRLKTSNAAIECGGFTGRSAFIETSNAKIVGFFGGVQLRVKTSNAPIDSTNIMWAMSDDAAAEIELKTSNGAINVRTMVGSDYENTALRLVATTSGAPLDIVAWQASDTRLFVDAITSTAPARIATTGYDDEFQGTYDLRTSGAQACVVEVPLRRPSEKNRTVIRTSTGEHAQGSVYWSHGGEPVEGWNRGSIKVVTSEFPVTLYLGEPHDA